MTDNKRFGLDPSGIDARMKEGVDSLEKVQEICTLLHTSVQEGLSSFPAHLSLRESAFGKNEYSAQPPPHYSQTFFSLLAKSYSELQPRFIRNILVCAMIFYVVFIVIIVDPGAELSTYLLIILAYIIEPLAFLCVPIFMEARWTYRKQVMLNIALQRVGNTGQTATVMRGGELTAKVKFEDIVVGDIVQLSPGDVVPGDGLLLGQDNGLVFGTTGSDGAYSYPGFGVCAGSAVSKGKGQIVIVAVGSNTRLGQIISEPPQNKELFPVTYILVIATVMGLSFFFTMTTMFLFNTYIIEQMPGEVRHLQQIMTFFGYSVNCFLLMIPFSLPLIIVWILHRSKDSSKAFHGIFKIVQLKVIYNILIVSVMFIHYALIPVLFISGLQKIWMNTFATLLALLLYPTDDANRPLKGADEILTMARETLRNIAGQVFWQLGILLGLILLGGPWLDLNTNPDTGPTAYNTMIFNTLAFMTLFNLFCVRVGKVEKNCFAGILKHRIFCVVWILAAILQLIITQCGGLLFNIHPLTLTELIISLCLALSIFIWTQILVFICFRNNEQSNRARDYENNETEL